MQKFIQFLSLILVIAINSNAKNINKPFSSQYCFIENKGQIIDQNNNPNPSVLYLYNGNGLRVQLRKEGFSYEVINTIKTPKTIIDKVPHGKFYSEADSFDITCQTHRVDINFKDGNKNATLKPFQPASDFINYYTTGTSEAGVTNVHHYQKIVYENVYPNIDIEFVLNDAANRGKFKYNFIVKPNGNLTDIKLAFLGANRTSLNQAGNILIETAYGNIEENIPLSYVITNNNSHSSIKANFIELDNNTYGINAENYNHNQTLVIDPTNWATLFGGIGYDVGSGIATDTSGNNIIIGNTQSINAIATVGAHQTILGGLYQDAFVAKFNNIGTLLWATYYGGIDADYGTGIATDISGNIIIGGYTYSSIGIATAGAYQTAISSGSFEAFITKFNTNGIRQWATYYGGNNQDQVFGITTDVFNNIIVTGLTNSTNAIATIGAYQTTYGGWNLDAFVAKFSDIGNLLWATYYGGNADDIGYGITSDVNNNIIVVGRTNSSNGIATVGSVKAFNFANYDGFVAKFNQSGGMLWATYLGGNFTDQANAVITDGNADIIVTGKSQTTNGGNYYAYITKFNTNGTRPWFNFYSGNVSSEGNGITIDASGNIIINGTTNSTTGIATIGAYQTTNAGYDISFFAKFNSNGVVQWGTYFGGGALNGNVITTDANGNIIITGATNSNSIVSIGAYQSINGGSSDAFIAKFSSNGVLPIKLISFNAALAYEKVNCAWETASETNNDYFTIERSKDGNDFEAVGNIKGQGNSNRNIRYSYIDNNPFSGISYYRLKQTDFDGKYTYSPIKKVGSTEKLATEISLYYENNNPIVKINSLTESIANMELINLNGIKLFTNEQPIIKGENTFEIEGNIIAGLYLLKVQVEDEVKYFKVWLR